MRRGREPIRVAIIGAGLGGIAAAVKLRKRTSATFVIFEQSAGVGGTWFDNRYPGCEVDVHSHAYSFSFLKYDWPRTHATQPELLAYAEHVVQRFGLTPHLRLNTRVTDLVWEESTSCYRLSTEHGDSEEFDVVISALGLLNVPRYPDWPGLDTFTGPCFHTSRWEEHDLTGKSVAVVGTGSTAVQIVPSIAPYAGKVHVFQREPGWIEPKNEREFSPRERWFYRNVPLAQRLHRAWIFHQGNRRFKGYDVGSRRQRRMREACERFIADAVQDPATRAAVTPDYPWGCKRPVISSTFYPSLNRDNVELVPHAVSRVTPTGVVDSTGTARDIDVLILGTGFQPTRFLASLDVKGRDGRGIHDAWRERASAFLGITVPGFPNFFILYGPNTNGGVSIIAQLERQAEVVVRAVRRLERTRRRSVDTSPAVARRFVAWLDRRMSTNASAMNSGCHNYYHDPAGHNVTQWPGGHLSYAIATRLISRLGLRTPR
ncbi:NAD(P)/FAD-dependent oxidoreductase [Plantactinospora sp. KLBMP9567]|uniref:flavin-containing monooxygenase n=1 Tax=Plantactinospora sp. KLBMP9567 TaxID=3085900 RepID=UPI00298115DA|nr:NAD(P)/FAD-dependent oxidoreductase [Plantactinospora sp. KLBMP9567]MDW5324171.1 NAD(P)/FAD-dependent oxidoreductase [Plantactinospora sp. KLBMP9567]